MIQGRAVVSWVQTLAKFTIPDDAEFSPSMVPTVHCPAIVHVSLCSPWVKTAGLRPDRNRQICINNQVITRSWINQVQAHSVRILCKNLRNTDPRHHRRPAR